MDNIKCVSDAVLRLLKKMGRPLDFTCKPNYGGGNNRVYLVSQGADKFLAKEYYAGQGDLRERGLSEYRFSRALWDGGIRAIPEPFGYDSDARVGLYNFIVGEKISPSRLAENYIRQGFDFFRDINKKALRDSFDENSFAAESCFSIHEHILTVRRRIERLKSSIEENESDDTKKAYNFVSKELSPISEQIVRRIVERAKVLGIGLSDQIGLEHRCISPSDFGFHNALIVEDSKVIFFDFEYAGWDDPAKTIADFFCQPEVPIQPNYKEEFFLICHQIFGDIRIEERVEMLMPLYQIKWCCILLNEFMPVESKRRVFAGHELEHRRKLQLLKANQLIASIVSTKL